MQSPVGSLLEQAPAIPNFWIDQATEDEEASTAYWLLAIVERGCELNMLNSSHVILLSDLARRIRRHNDVSFGKTLEIEQDCHALIRMLKQIVEEAQVVERENLFLVKENSRLRRLRRISKKLQVTSIPPPTCKEAEFSFPDEFGAEVFSVGNLIQSTLTESCKHSMPQASFDWAWNEAEELLDVPDRYFTNFRDALWLKLRLNSFVDQAVFHDAYLRRTCHRLRDENRLLGGNHWRSNLFYNMRAAPAVFKGVGKRARVRRTRSRP